MREREDCHGILEISKLEVEILSNDDSLGTLFLTTGHDMVQKGEIISCGDKPIRVRFILDGLGPLGDLPAPQGWHRRFNWFILLRF